MAVVESSLTSKTAAAKRDAKVPTPKASAGSVFDRLYKTQTLSSKSRKPARAAARTAGAAQAVDKPPKIRSTRPKTTPKPVFNRLYNKGTESSKQKRSDGTPPVKNVPAPGSSSTKSRQPMKPRNWKRGWWWWWWSCFETSGYLRGNRRFGRGRSLGRMNCT